MAKSNERRWAVPSKRAENYAEERKLKVHNRGKKEGQQLTDYEAGIRSGYLQCQSDHAGLYKYKKALNDGLDKKEAKRLSRIRGKEAKNKKK
ncbi:MAG: hypothetical protein J6M26_00905 [Clostridia bacterium]|nr:hypothetical protein [Clostridia bacterium]